jgi:hypothetical protein
LNVTHPHLIFIQKDFLLLFLCEKQLKNWIHFKRKSEVDKLFFFTTSSSSSSASHLRQSKRRHFLFLTMRYFGLLWGGNRVKNFQLLLAIIKKAFFHLRLQFTLYNFHLIIFFSFLFGVIIFCFYIIYFIFTL